MPKATYKPNNKRYRKESFGKSVLDGKPTLILNRYWTPKPYVQPVQDVLVAFHSGIPFNTACDQVATLYKDTVNRNKLAEHTLKTIANDC